MAYKDNSSIHISVHRSEFKVTAFDFQEDLCYLSISLGKNESPIVLDIYDLPIDKAKALLLNFGTKDTLNLNRYKNC